MLKSLLIVGGAGFEFLSCFCAGFVCLLSEEAAENGANFGEASPLVEFAAAPEFDTSVQPKPQLSSFPASVAVLHKSGLVMQNFFGGPFIIVCEVNQR